MKEHICPKCSSRNTINVEDACNVSCFETWKNERRKVGSHTERYWAKDKNGKYNYQYISVDDYGTFRVSHMLVSNLVLDEKTKPPVIPNVGGMVNPTIKGDFKAFGCLLFFIVPIVLNVLAFLFPRAFYTVERTLNVSEGVLFAGIVVLIVLLLIGRHVIAFFLNVNTAVQTEKKKQKYLAEYDEWKKKYICMRCGYVFEDTEDDKSLTDLRQNSPTSTPQA